MPLHDAVAEPDVVVLGQQLPVRAYLELAVAVEEPLVDDELLAAAVVHELEVAAAAMQAASADKRERSQRSDLHLDCVEHDP